MSGIISSIDNQEDDSSTSSSNSSSSNDDDDDNIICNQFDKAVIYTKSCKKKLSDTDKLQLYGLFKQSTIGNVNISRPSILDFVGKAKWDSWESYSGLNEKEAKVQYLKLIDKFYPEWNDEDGEESNNNNVHSNNNSGDGDDDDDDDDDDDTTQGFGQKVSTMLGNDEENDDGQVKDIFYHVKNGNIDDIQKILVVEEEKDNNDIVKINQKDEFGITPLMHAADNANVEMIEFLLSQGADLEIKDDEDGYTALCYAVICSHERIVELLIKAGADKEIVFTSSDIDISEEIKMLLS